MNQQRSSVYALYAKHHFADLSEISLVSLCHDHHKASYPSPARIFDLTEAAQGSRGGVVWNHSRRPRLPKYGLVTESIFCQKCSLQSGGRWQDIIINMIIIVQSTDVVTDNKVIVVGVNHWDVNPEDGRAPFLCTTFSSARVQTWMRA